MANAPVMAGGTSVPVRLQRASGAWKPLLAFTLFTVFVVVASQVAFNHYKAGLKQDAQNELGGIAELKKDQIAAWLAERLGDAKTLSEDPLFLAEFNRWLQQGCPPGKTSGNLTKRLAALQDVYSYSSISLFDNRGVQRLSFPPDGMPMGGDEKKGLLESMRTGKVEFSEIHQDSSGPQNQVEIELRAPLVVFENGKARTIGAALFRMNPSVFLFPLIQRWPTPSVSAESVLVRREGGEVVFLNKLRHINNVPLAMRRPLGDTQFLATKAAMGQEGLVEGVDYRGVEVVGALKKIPGTSWAMVSKIDKAEIYAPIDLLARWIEALMVVIVCVGGGLVLYWRQKEKTQFEHQIERQVLATRVDYLAKYSNDIILLLDGAGKVVDFNDRALEAYGYSAAEFSGMSVDDTRAAGLSLPVAERLKKVDEAGGGLVFESVHMRRNGDKFPVETSVRRIDIAGGKFYQAINRDITERKKAEGMARFHGEILNNLSEGVFLVRLDQETIVYANPRFEHMFGYGSGELIGKHVSVINAPGPRDPQEVSDEINEALQKKGGWTGEVRNCRKDGSIFWCQTSISVFDHPEYGKIGLSVHEDITERKNRGREIRERRMVMDELQTLHVAAQTASAIAHELNQPLLAIASYSKAALLMMKSDKPDYDEIRVAIEGSERQAHRAGHSIRELFDFLHSNEFPLEDFDMVREIALIIEDARQEHELLFQSVIRVDEQLPPVRANRTHVHKALFNLLRNGIEAARRQPGGPMPAITIKVGKTGDGDFAEVTVRDNGPGLAGEIAGHLFEPFYTTKSDGFGMGLSISRSLIEMNGGQLYAAPNEGPGAVFHLTVPFAETA
jgi:PAS domain S-box-containing protein